MEATNHVDPKDLKFLRLLPLLANWIKENKELTDKQITAFFNLFPEHFTPASLEKMFGMASHYRHHKTFGNWIGVVLSPEGKAWIENASRRFNKLSDK